MKTLLIDIESLILLQKKHVFGSVGMVAGMDSQTLACAREGMLLSSLNPYP
jgi:hypothetical protein